MAYDEFLADRVRRFFQEKKVHASEKKMMGGLCFLVDEKMCCAILFDKKQQTDFLMARIGESASLAAMEASSSSQYAINASRVLAMSFGTNPSRISSFLAL